MKWTEDKVGGLRAKKTDQGCRPDKGKDSRENKESVSNGDTGEKTKMSENK